MRQYLGFMMKVCVFLCFLATALGRPNPGNVGFTDSVVVVIPGIPVRIQEAGEDYSVDNRLQEEHIRNRRASGFSYTTPDGTRRTEQLETYVDPRVRDHHPLNRITGTVSWTSPEGVPISMHYVADGSGYHILPAPQQ